MTIQEQGQEVRRLTDILKKASRRAGPFDFQPMLGAILANLTASMPGDYWAVMMETHPCKIPGCDCHVLADEVMKVLDKLRSDHKTTMGQRKNN